MPTIICEGCHGRFWWKNTIERRFCSQCIEHAKIVNTKKYEEMIKCRVVKEENPKNNVGG